MKILCILYDDPKTVMPKRYALDDIPKLEKYPDEMTLPSQKKSTSLQVNCWVVYRVN